MDLFGGVILAIVATGAILVVGGIVLIASGALKVVGDKNAKTTMKVGDFLQIGTTVPGLGIFLLGLAFESISLVYANQARHDSVVEQVRDAVQKERQDHVMQLSGIVSMPTEQDVRVSVCMGQQLVVRSNNPFNNRIGPYLDFVVVRLETEGAPPQLITVYGRDDVPESFRNFSRLVRPRNGVVDIQTRLEQVVDLTPAIRSIALPPAPPAADVPAGSAYGPSQ
jgi:hypothetical protein